MGLGFWAILICLAMAAGFILPVAFLAIIALAVTKRMWAFAMLTAVAAAVSAFAYWYDSTHCMTTLTGDWTCVVRPFLIADAIGIPSCFAAAAYAFRKMSSQHKEHV